MGAMAQFERSLVIQRTKAGMAAAKKRGKHIGRPRALASIQLHHLDDLLKKGRSKREIAELLDI